MLDKANPQPLSVAAMDNMDHKAGADSSADYSLSDGRRADASGLKSLCSRLVPAAFISAMLVLRHAG